MTNLGVRTAMSVAPSGSRFDRDTEVKSVGAKPRSSSACATVGAVVHTKRSRPSTSRRNRRPRLNTIVPPSLTCDEALGASRSCPARLITRVPDHVTDVRRGGVDRLGLAVDDQVDGLVHVGPGDGSADDSGEYGPVQAVLHAAQQDKDSSGGAGDTVRAITEP